MNTVQKYYCFHLLFFAYYIGKYKYLDAVTAFMSKVPICSKTVSFKEKKLIYYCVFLRDAQLILLWILWRRRKIHNLTLNIVSEK